MSATVDDEPMTSAPMNIFQAADSMTECAYCRKQISRATCHKGKHFGLQRVNGKKKVKEEWRNYCGDRCASYDQMASEG